MHSLLIFSLLFFLGSSIASFLMCGRVGGRSKCDGCGRKLEWYELMPVISWLVQFGKTKCCGEKLSWKYLFGEVILGLWFVGCYLWFGWNVYLLSNIFLILSLVLGSIFFVLVMEDLDDMSVSSIVEVVGAVAVLGGLYGILYLLSGGRWIGFGDVKLGVGLGLFLSNWRQALLALFLANLIGCIVVIPGLISRKLTSTSHIPFGPFLVAGMMLAFFWSEWLISRLLSLQLF
jgi:prepilin signal peptidase PulO-like enzyme (type II secretory pathway)